MSIFMMYSTLIVIYVRTECLAPKLFADLYELLYLCSISDIIWTLVEAMMELNAR